MNLYENTQLATLTDEESRIIEEVKKEVFDSNISDRLSMVEDLIQEWMPGAEDTVIAEFLKSLWNYFYAVKLIREERSIIKVFSLIEEASNGFRQVGQKELANLSEGLRAYAGAITELRKFNVHKALELFNSTTGYFQEAGIYSNSIRPLMDHMKPDALFTAAMQALQMPDFSSAEILTKQASMASEKLAKDYYETGTLAHSTYRGLACFYKANLTLNSAFSNFNNLEYEKLAGNKDLTKEATQAQVLLKQADLEDTNIRNCLYICEAIVETLEVITELSSFTLSALKSTVKIDSGTLQKLKDKANSALSSASQAGTQGVAYVGLCEDLYNRIQKFKRFAKPDRKKLVIFSGSVTAILFIPLYAIVSLLNSTFNTDFGSLMLFTSCLVIALAAGFGYGTLKFKRTPGFSQIANNPTDEKGREQTTVTET